MAQMLFIAMLRLVQYSVMASTSKFVITQMQNTNHTQILVAATISHFSILEQLKQSRFLPVRATFKHLKSKFFNLTKN